MIWFAVVELLRDHYPGEFRFTKNMSGWDEISNENGVKVSQYRYLRTAWVSRYHETIDASRILDKKFPEELPTADSIRIGKRYRDAWEGNKHAEKTWEEEGHTVDERLVSMHAKLIEYGWPGDKLGKKIPAKPATYVSYVHGYRRELRKLQEELKRKLDEEARLVDENN